MVSGGDRCRLQLAGRAWVVSRTIGLEGYRPPVAPSAQWCNRQIPQMRRSRQTRARIESCLRAIISWRRPLRLGFGWKRRSELFSRDIRSSMKRFENFTEPKRHSARR